MRGDFYQTLLKSRECEDIGPRGKPTTIALPNKYNDKITPNDVLL